MVLGFVTIPVPCDPRKHGTLAQSYAIVWPWASNIVFNSEKDGLRVYYHTCALRWITNSHLQEFLMVLSRGLNVTEQKLHITEVLLRMSIDPVSIMRTFIERKGRLTLCVCVSFEQTEKWSSMPYYCRA